MFQSSHDSDFGGVEMIHPDLMKPSNQVPLGDEPCCVALVCWFSLCLDIKKVQTLPMVHGHCYRYLIA